MKPLLTKENIMNIITKIILSTVTVTIVAVTAMYVQYVGSTEALVERFPDIDPKIVRKLSKEMYMEALTGKYADIESTDDALDKIFLEKVQLLNAK